MASRWSALLFLAVGLSGCEGRRDRAASPPSPAPSPSEKVAQMPAPAADTAAAAADPAAPSPTVPAVPDAPVATMAPGWAAIVPIVRGAASADSIAIDSKGNLVLAVSYRGKVDAGGGEVDGGEGGALLLKVAPSGAPLWSKVLGAERSVEFVRVAVDAQDAIVLTAAIVGTVDVGGGPLQSAGNADILLARFAPDGSHVWSRRFGGVEPDRPAGIAVDAGGGIALAGYYGDTVDFGGRSLKSAHDAEMFAARYTAEGKLGWAKRISGGGTEKSELYDVTIDASGKLIAIGSFTDRVDLGGKSLVADKAKAMQTFVVAYGQGGAVAWATAYAPGAMTLANAVATDSKGSVLLAGSDLHTPLDDNNMVAFDLQSGAPTQGGMTAFIGALGPDHEPRWFLPVGAIGLGGGSNLAVAAGDDLLVAGEADTAPFGDASLTGASAYAARLSAAGKLVWARAVPGAVQSGIPRIAARGETIVVTAQTDQAGQPALSLFRPEVISP